MPDHELTTSGPQFRLRGLFVMLTLAAIAIAAIAPFLQQWTTEQWRQLAIAGACFALGMGLPITLFSLGKGIRRRKIEQQVGSPTIRLRNPTFFPPISSWQLLLLSVPTATLLLFLPLLHFHGKFLSSTYLLFFVSGQQIANATLMGSGREVTAGANGVVMRGQLHLWWSIAVAADGDRIRLAGQSFEVVGELMPEEITQILEWRYGKKQI